MEHPCSREVWESQQHLNGQWGEGAGGGPVVGTEEWERRADPSAASACDERQVTSLSVPQFSCLLNWANEHYLPHQGKCL